MASGKGMAANRLDNLRRLIDEHWDGKRAGLERELGVAKGLVSKWFQRGHMPDAQARNVENLLGLDVCSLDRRPSSPTKLYYVMVSIRGHRIRDFIEYLRSSEIVREVSALFGEMDVFVKVESTEQAFQELVLRKMQRYPGVRYTKTFQALEGAHWQKAQEAVELEPRGDKSNENLVSRIVNKKMEMIFNSLASLDNRIVTVSECDPFHIHPKEILEKVREAVCWTSRFSKDKYLDNGEVNESCEKAARQKGIAIRKLFLLDTPARDDMSRVKSRVMKDIERGVVVRILNEEDWVRSLNNATPEGYIIADQDLVLIQKKREDCIRFGDDDISNYRENFNNNWQKADELEKFLEKTM